MPRELTAVLLLGLVCAPPLLAEEGEAHRLTADTTLRGQVLDLDFPALHIGIAEYPEGPNNVIEVAILVMAREWRAQFEWWAHALLARREGVPEDVIAAIGEGSPPRFENLDEELVYDFARELLETRRVGDGTYEAVVERFGNEGVMDLVTLLGYYSLVSMTLNVFDVAVPEGQAIPFPESQS